MLGKQILLIRLILASKYKYQILDMGIIQLKNNHEASLWSSFYSLVHQN